MNHYETLGVAKNATPDEIKKAYIQLLYLQLSPCHLEKLPKEIKRKQ